MQTSCKYELKRCWKKGANNVERVKCKGTMTKWPVQEQTPNGTKHAQQQDIIGINNKSLFYILNGLLVYLDIIRHYNKTYVFA